MKSFITSSIVLAGLLSFGTAALRTATAGETRNEQGKWLKEVKWNFAGIGY